MDPRIEVINTVFPVLLVIIIGMLVRKTGLLTRENVDGLKTVAVNIALPAVMLHAFAVMEYSWKNIILTGMMFLVCVVSCLLGKLLMPVFRLKSGFVPFMTTGFEAGMLGYSLFMVLYGADKISAFAGIDLGQVLFVFTLYKILIGLNGKERPSAPQLFKEMVQSPVIIAITAGLILGVSGLYGMMAPSGVSSILDACTGFISAPTSVMILITIGYDLVPGEIAWKKAGMTVVLRFVIMAVMRVLTGIVVHALGMGEALDPALNIMFILPLPYVLPVFAEDESERTYISSVISATTLCTVIGFVILAALKAV